MSSNHLNIKYASESCLLKILNNVEISNYIETSDNLYQLTLIASLNDNNLGIRATKIICDLIVNYEITIPFFLRYNCLICLLFEIETEPFEISEDIFNAVLRILLFLKPNQTHFLQEFQVLRKLGFLDYNENLTMDENPFVSRLAKQLDKILWYSH